MNNLKAGLRWARHETGGYKKEWSRWVVVRLTGTAPFLTGSIEYDPGEDGPETHLSFSQHVDKWQFGPELEIPSRHYVEVRNADERK